MVVLKIYHRALLSLKMNWNHSKTKSYLDVQYALFYTIKTKTINEGEVHPQSSPFNISTYWNTTLLQLPPLRFHCVGRCWVWTQDFLALTISRSNHSARSHPRSAGSHSRSESSHPQLGQFSSTLGDSYLRVHSDRSHPHSAILIYQYTQIDLIHTRLDQIHAQKDLIHNSARSHPHSAIIIYEYTRLNLIIHAQKDLIHNSTRAHPHSAILIYEYAQLDLNHTRLDLIHAQEVLIHNQDRSHPHSARSNLHSARSHPHSARSHSRSEWSHPQLAYRSHPYSARSHSRSERARLDPPLNTKCSCSRPPPLS